MRIVAVIVPQVAPGLVIQRGNIGEWRRAKLRIRAKKAGNLRRVKVAYYALAAPPVVTVAIF